jgi:4-hydroxy-3-polyprenylbenzoate decarboxylase
MLSVEPDTNAPVVLRGDLQLRGRDTAIAAWAEMADPSRLIDKYRNRGTRMPLAIVIGGDPAVRLAVAAPLTPAVDPLGLAGLLREKPIDAVACRSLELLVPAESDFVIECHIDPAESEVRVPRQVSSAGLIVGGRPGNNLQVTAVTHRANRVFPAAIAGTDGNECCVIDRLLARLFLPFLQSRMPELVDFDLPYSGGARHLAILAIERTYADQPRHVATVAWGMRPFQFARLLVMVDADVDVRDAEQVLAAITQESHLTDDIWELAGPGDPLDRMSPSGELTRRLTIDATRDRRDKSAAPIERFVTDRWSEYGLGPEEES